MNDAGEERGRGSGDGALVATVAGIALFHVLDHRLIPERFHVVSHPTAGIATIVTARASGLSWDEVGLAPSSIPRGVTLGALHSLGALAIVGLGPLLPNLAPMLDDDRLDATIDGSLKFPTLVEIPLSTALYEELVFRGALLGLLTRRFGELGGVVTSSLLFGLWHVLPALEDRKHNTATGDRHPMQTVAPTVIGTTFAGAWFSWLRKRGNSVLTPMMVHAVTNSGALASATVVSRRRRRVAETRQAKAVPPAD